jgi:hypothetical protein
MDYATFKHLYYTLPKNDSRRLAAIEKYPGYVNHVRVMSMKKLMEIRARKVDKTPA